MTIDSFEKGKKYWRKYTRTVRSREEVTLDKIFVVEVDLKKKRILASVNGLPPQLFKEPEYSRWKKDKPEC